MASHFILINGRCFMAEQIRKKVIFIINFKAWFNVFENENLQATSNYC
jgi:hypothetical protein